jgi:hypothetical protein
MHLKGMLGLCGAIVAAIALVSASGATTTKTHKIARIDVSSRAAIVHYLRSHHMNTKGLVIQRGLRNYAGPRCPGQGWRCARTLHTVVQIARPGGKNRFWCSAARCAVLQVAAAPSRGSNGVCIRATGLTQSCTINQSGAGPNSAVVYENAESQSGLTQTASSTALITQVATGTAPSNGNTACVTQNVKLTGSTTAKKGMPVTVMLEAHQSVTIKQDVAGAGTNNAVKGATSSGTCDTTTLGQNQTLNSIANGSGSITQNEDAAFSGCGDLVPGDYANLCLDIEQNQGSVGLNHASGPNNATFTQTSSQKAIANTTTNTGSVTQTQSSICSDPNAPADCQEPGGLVGTVNQYSTGVSTANAAQTETQCEDAATSGLTDCHTAPGDADFNGAYQLTQNQYGPVGVGKLRNRHRGRQPQSTFKGLGTAKQTGNNDQDTFTISQTSTQDNDQGSGGSTSNQQNFGQADCSTPGNCTSSQTTTVNGSMTQVTQSGQSIDSTVNCTGSACTTSPANEIVGNNARFGGGPIQTYDLSTGSLVNSFVPDGAQSTNANGRAVAVEGTEVFYSELSGDGFGPSDGIHVAPFNGGAGGHDLRVLPNPAPTTGIQDLEFSNGNLYALTGYPNGTLQVWELNPNSGAVIAGPVAIGSPAAAGADGFTVLPGGNFLINDGDGSCTYREYDSTTGQQTGQSITVPGGSFCTGVETDGASLYFQTNFDSFTRTDLSGNLIATTNVGSNTVEDVSLG